MTCRTNCERCWRRRIPEPLGGSGIAPFRRGSDAVRSSIPGDRAPSPARRGEARSRHRWFFRRTGEALRNLHPGMRSGADDAQCRIGHVPDLGDHLAEIQCVAFDPVIRGKRIPLPYPTGGSGKTDVGRRPRFLKATIGEGPAIGPHSDLGDVAKPVGRSPGRPNTSKTSCPCAHVSIWRAMVNMRSPMSGPVHLRRVDVGRVASLSQSASTLPCHCWRRRCPVRWPSR